ncbi:MAG TPA: hypothetical protein VIK89_15195 [Cytophagaceae bacterium]
MKFKKLHIVFSLLILANLLLVQIVPNYLHTHESFKREFCGEVHIEAEIQVKAEECKLCSIDLFHDLFCQPVATILFENSFESDWAVAKTQDTFLFIYSTCGRSPPSVFHS